MDPDKVLLYPFQETSYIKSFISLSVITSFSIAITIELREHFVAIIKKKNKDIYESKNNSSVSLITKIIFCSLIAFISCIC